MGLIVAFYVKTNTPHYVTPCGVPVCFFRFSRDSAADAAASPGYYMSPPWGSEFGGHPPARFLQIAISLIVPTRTQGIIPVEQAGIAVWVNKAREGLAERLRLSAQ